MRLNKRFYCIFNHLGGGFIYLVKPALSDSFTLAFHLQMLPCPLEKYCSGFTNKHYHVKCFLALYHT